MSSTTTGQVQNEDTVLWILGRSGLLMDRLPIYAQLPFGMEKGN